MRAWHRAAEPRGRTTTAGRSRGTPVHGCGQLYRKSSKDGPDPDGAAFALPLAASQGENCDVSGSTADGGRVLHVAVAAGPAGRAEIPHQRATPRASRDRTDSQGVQ